MSECCGHSGVVLDKPKVNNIAGVGLVARAKNPQEIFLEMKDGGHPVELVRGQLCIVGGNWINKEAESDQGPLDTAKREWLEELSLDRKPRDPQELVNLKIITEEDALSLGPTYSEATAKPATDSDRKRLAGVVSAIRGRFMPFGTFTCHISQKAIYSANPNSKRTEFTSLSCVWIALLEEDVWKELMRLQQKYLNLSNESLSFMTSLDQMIERNLYGAFGYDRVLQKYFGAMGYRAEKNLPLVPDIEVKEMGAALATYEEYLEKFNVARTPFTSTMK